MYNGNFWDSTTSGAEVKESVLNCDLKPICEGVAYVLKINALWPHNVTNEVSQLFVTDAKSVVRSSNSACEGAKIASHSLPINKNMLTCCQR